MPDRGAWVRQAWREYHAGRLTLAEVTAMVRQHRPPEPAPHDPPPSVIANRHPLVLPSPPDE